MNTQRIFGVVLLVVGGILLFIGINASESFADQMSKIFTGRFTQDTVWYIAGGFAVALLGLLMVLFGARGRHA